MPDRSRRFPWPFYCAAAILTVLLAAAPMLSVIISGIIAEANGCVLHEGFSNPCLIGDSDIGRTLYGFYVLGWFALATLPLGAAALLALALVAAIHWFVWRRRRLH